MNSELFATHYINIIIHKTIKVGWGAVYIITIIPCLARHLVRKKNYCTFTDIHISKIYHRFSGVFLDLKYIKPKNMYKQKEFARNKQCSTIFKLMNSPNRHKHTRTLFQRHTHIHIYCWANANLHLAFSFFHTSFLFDVNILFIYIFWFNGVNQTPLCLNLIYTVKNFGIWFEC